MPEISNKSATRLSNWVTLIAKNLTKNGNSMGVYHSLAQADYINIVCELDDGRIPLVKQFRPAVEDFTIELPGGIADSDLAYEVIAENELKEEVGVYLQEAFEPLGVLIPDTGRLENRAHIFFAKGAKLLEGWIPEPGVERLLVTKSELNKMISTGEFSHAIHLAAIFLAERKLGFLSEYATTGKL